MNKSIAIVIKDGHIHDVLSEFDIDVVVLDIDDNESLEDTTIAEAFAGIKTFEKDPSGHYEATAVIHGNKNADHILESNAYRWESECKRPIPHHHIDVLKNKAILAITQKAPKGYEQGELSTQIGGISYKGSWNV